MNSLNATASKDEYGPFGEVIRATGPLAKLNPFRFSTKYQDNETDLLYYGYRYYTASTGRWLSRDPIEEKGGLNLYATLNNDTIAKIDVNGMAGMGNLHVAERACSCGPDVTEALHETLDRVNAAFASWSLTNKFRACTRLFDRSSGAALKAWDIDELYHFGGKGKNVGCARTVTFNGKCYYGGAVNYALFGRACALCDKAFPDSWFDMGSAIDAVAYYKIVYQYGLASEEAAEAIPFTMYGFLYGQSPNIVPFVSGAKCGPTLENPLTGPFHWMWRPVQNEFGL